METLFIASNNPTKFQEIVPLVSGQFDRILTPKDIDSFEPEEDGSTYEENVLIKARYWYNKTKLPTLADDSGLNIIALNDFPGVNTAPFTKGFKSYYEAQNHLFDKLQHYPDKSITFICILAYIDVLGGEHIFKGTLEGTFIFPPKGDGYAYDTIMVPHGYTQTIAELGSVWKKEHSHRSKALNDFIKYVTI